MQTSTNSFCIMDRKYLDAIMSYSDRKLKVLVLRNRISLVDIMKFIDDDALHQMVVERFINAKINVNAKTGRYNLSEDTALHIAAEKGKTHIIKMLLDAGADRHITNNLGYTALDYSAGRQDTDCLQALLDSGSSDENGNALFYAVISRSLPCIKLLIKHKAEMGPALIKAAEFEIPEYVKLLIDSGANINFQHHEYGWTAAYEAVHAYKTDTTCLELLIAAGANINIQRDDGYAPIHRAALYGNLCATKILLNANADITKLTKDGETVLSLAYRYPKIMDILVSMGANIDINASPRSKTAIYKCIHGSYPFSGNSESFRILLLSGANPFINNDVKGYTGKSLEECKKIYFQFEQDLQNHNKKLVIVLGELASFPEGIIPALPKGGVQYQIAKQHFYKSLHDTSVAA